MFKFKNNFTKNLKKSSSKLLLSTLTVLLLLLLCTLTVAAAGAKLFLSPATGTYHVGDYLSVEVLVDTGGNVTNAYKAFLAYPAEKLSAVSVSTGGSICSLWIPPSPSYSNAGNTAAFECGTTSRYKGAAGRIGTITFVVKAAGTATVSIASGQVKKADGAGTEILNVRDSSSFTLQELPEGVPTISSSTHPDQNAWYQSKTVDLSWSTEASAKADGFSYLLSRKSEDTLDDTSEGAETNKTYASLEDGIWYFHLKAHRPEATPAGGQGWSSVSRFRIQIDSQPPEDFEVVSDPPADRVFRAPLISFAATDKLSGVDHYEISIDEGEFTTAVSPYRFTQIRSGTHEIVVRAVDRAGNIKDSRLTLSVIGVPSPTIVRPTEGENIPLLAPLKTKIAVTAPGTVELLLDDQLFATLDSSTGFELERTYRKILSPRKHQLSAVFVNADGIESEPEEVSFVVNPREVYLLGFVLPWYFGYPILVAIFALLMFFPIRFIRKFRAYRRRKKAEKATGQPDNSTTGREEERTDEKSPEK